MHKWIKLYMDITGFYTSVTLSVSTRFDLSPPFTFFLGGIVGLNRSDFGAEIGIIVLS